MSANIGKIYTKIVNKMQNILKSIYFLYLNDDRITKKLQEKDSQTRKKSQGDELVHENVYFKAI